MNTQRKKLLFIMQQGPLQSAKAKEAFDIVLMASSFEHEISLVFINDGIFQLLDQQDSSLLGIKNFTNSYKALSLYDIENVFISSTDLTKRGLTTEQLQVTVKPLTDTEIRELIQQHDVIFNG